LGLLAFSALALEIQYDNRKQLLANFRTKDKLNYMKSISYFFKLLINWSTSPWWRIITWTQIY